MEVAVNYVSEGNVSVAWHAAPAAEVLHRMGSAPTGLSRTEAAQRRARHGPNAFRRPRCGSDIMRQPPRDPKAAILSRPMLRATAGYGGLIAASALGAFGWALATQSNIGRATTMTFMTLALAQILHLGNARSEGPVTNPRLAFANLFAVAAAALAILIQLLLAPALGHALGLEPLEAQDWMVVGGLAIIPALVGQTMKILRPWWRRDQRPA